MAPKTEKRISRKERLEEQNKLIDKMLKRGVNHSRAWAPLYVDGLNYLYNNQLADVKRRDGWERVQVNQIFPALMQEQALLAQRKTKMVTQPWEPRDKDGADLWANILQWQYEKGLDIAMRRMEAVLDGKIYGHYIAKVYWEPKHEWDEENKAWKGAVQITVVRPEFFGMDPDAEGGGLEKAEYCYLYRRVSVKWAKAKWPEYAEQIQAAAGQEPEGDPLSQVSLQVTATGSRVVLDDATAVTGEGGTGIDATGMEGRLAELISLAGQNSQLGGKQDGEEDKTQVALLEIYYRDREEKHVVEQIPIPIQDLIDAGTVELRGHVYVIAETGETLTPENQPTEKVEYDRPVYPNGRYVLRIGKEILNPEPEDQVWRYRAWPFVIGVNYMLPHSWHGLNGSEMVRGVQDWLNVAAAHLINYVKFFGDPIIKVEEGALQNDPDNRGVAEKIKARAGAIWKLAAGKRDNIAREEPASLSGGLVEIFRMFEQFGRDTTGVQEIAMGKQATGDITATEATRLDTMTRLRSGLQSLLQDIWTVQVMTLVHEVAKRNMTPGQMVRIAGDEQAPRIAQMTPEAIDARFDLKLDVTTSLPFDQQRQKQDARELFEILGPAYLRKLLEAYEVTDIEEILRMSQAWMMIQQALEQQQAQQEGAQTPPAEQPAEPALQGAPS